MMASSYRFHLPSSTLHSPRSTPMSNRTELLALLQIDGLGLEQVRWLIDAFGTAAGVFQAGARALSDEGVEPNLAQEIAAVNEDLLWSLTNQLMDYEDTAGVRFVPRGDEVYPQNLMFTDEVPLFLWLRGEPVAEDSRAVAVVGSWRATPRGFSNAELIGMRLAEQGYAVVAGLGDDIDIRALKGARDGAGRGLAVLAGGIEMVPPEQEKLAERVLERGALMSGALRPADYPSRARAGTRDDIIAGLAQAVIVVEAQPEDRGVEMAMRAHNVGRPVLVVKPRHDVPDGNRQLLEMGAAPIEHIGEMFEMLEEAMELFGERERRDDLPDASR
ncbi:MAG: DNA processing protein DprA [Anaerolineales bacterium]|nr:DNA processing protein DprA [Anaerolineales bacterium]